MSSENEAVRLDKWLWAARFYKTRSIARNMVDGGKVHYNGQRSKPSKIVELGAEIRLRQGNEEKTVIIEKSLIVAWAHPSLKRSTAKLKTVLINAKSSRNNVNSTPTTLVRNAAQIKSSAATSLSSNINKRRNYRRGKHSMANNVLHRYLFEDLSVRGELVQLDEAYQRIISSKEYPAALQKLLGELLVSTTLLTATLKFEGSITIQLQGDYSVSLAVINGDHDQKIRGVARWEGDIADNATLHEMMGKGYLVITIEPKKASVTKVSLA